MHFLRRWSAEIQVQSNQIYRQTPRRGWQLPCRHTEHAIIELMSDYAYRDSALEVIETENGYSLQLRPVFNDLTDNIIPAELGKAVLRTLAAIALKNTIIQTELIELRGSSAYQHVQELVELGFVRKYRQKTGRSYLLEITSQFHQYFEIDQLPKSMN